VRDYVLNVIRKDAETRKCLLRDEISSVHEAKIISRQENDKEPVVGRRLMTQSGFMLRLHKKKPRKTP